MLISHQFTDFSSVSLIEVQDFADYCDLCRVYCCLQASFRYSFQERFKLIAKIVIIQRRKYLTTIICTLPIILSAILSAAHFYRSGSLIFTVTSVLLPFLLVSKNHWVPKIITASLLLVAAEWIRTLFVLIEQYQAAGLSWTRMAIILIGVALFSAFSGLVFKTSTMKNRYEWQS